jgi:PAS domain S-box-containing protein
MIEKFLLPMIPVGSQPLRCGVVGDNSLAETLSGVENTDRSLDVGRVAAKEANELFGQEQSWDCLVVDCTRLTDDSIEPISQCTVNQQALSVVCLVDEWSDERVVGMGSVERTAFVPRTLVESAPERLTERIISCVEKGYAQTSLQELYDNISSLATLHNPESGEMIHANQAVCDLLGYDRSELLSMRVGDFTADLPGYDHERAMHIVRSAVDRDDPIEVEWPLLTATETVRWVEAELRPVEIGGRELVLSTSIDITDRRQQERKYQQVFHNVNDIITVHDPWHEELVDINETLSEITGYDREALLEMGVDGFSVTSEGFTAERAYELQRGVAAADEVRTVDWKITTANGGERSLEAVVSPATIAGEDRVLVLARDVTERERREREYEQVFNGVQDGILLMDPDTLDILDANEAYLDLVGYESLDTIQELGVRGLSATAEGYTFEEGLQIHQRVAETRDPEIVEWRLEKESGERRWLEVKIAPAVIGGQEVNITVHRDITERKRREREYEQIFNGVNDSITIHDPETAELLEVNDTFCDLLGYDREEIIEMGIEGYSPAGQGYTMEQAREFVQTVVESDDPQQTEWAVETSDGEIRWLEVKGTTVEIGGELRYLSIDRDITEWRRTERQLSEILDRIDEAILMTRADRLTIDPRSADYVSAGHEAIWGQSFEEIRDKHPNGILGTIHIDDVEEYRAYVEEIVEDISTGTAENRYSTEYRIERPDGETRWVQSDYYPLDWEEKQTRLIVVSRDITERKARERRIAAFDDATAELATADTPANATATAVEAATETLHLQAVGVFLYDNDDGVLYPEILTGTLSDHIVTESIEPGDSPLWEGFATGMSVASDGGRQRSGFIEDAGSPDELSDLAEWRALSLGNHGLLLVGSPTSSLDSETLQSAHVLAATLEAALNHLQGQQQLAAQQDEIRSQTQRIERLDRIAQLTQQVETAITDASMPGEIEQAICDRLADSSLFDLAWIGGLEVGSDRLTARAVVGSSDQYIDQLNLNTTTETADPHPALVAWRTDEVIVTDSIVSDGPSDNWRQTALAEGYQSLCAVPLTYDGITHGVLTVGADSPSEFGDRERSVLSQLGTSIANALTAIERRRALESDETIELEFRGSGDALQFAELANQTNCQVKHERTVSRQDGSISVYYNIDGGVPVDIGETARRTFRGSVEIVTEESSTLVEVRTDDWFGSPLAEYGSILRKAVATSDETVVTVEVPRQADVRAFTERLQAEAPSLDLTAKRQHRRQNQTPTELHDHIRSELTDRQFEVLQTAVSAGYFEWPRKNDGSDLADVLDITQPTVNKHLRLAEKQIFDLLIEPAD